MTLAELIARLQASPADFVVTKGFGRPHSYRGFYDELAFEPADNVTVASMLEHARSAIGKTFSGYKGGEYTMDEHTPVWIASYGDCGESIGQTLLDYMLGLARQQSAPSAPPADDPRSADTSTHD